MNKQELARSLIPHLIMQMNDPNAASVHQAKRILDVADAWAEALIQAESERAGPIKMFVLGE